MSEEDAKQTEKQLIKRYNTTDDRYGYNLTMGGDGACGRMVSEETKDKIRNAHVGKCHSEDTKARIAASLIGNHRALGYHHTEETKSKLSVANLGNQRAKGNHLSDETRRKMSESHKGLQKSVETRRKLSEANKGRKLSDDAKRRISEANKAREHRKGFRHTEGAKKKMSDAKKEAIAADHSIIDRLACSNKIKVDMLSIDRCLIQSFDSASDAMRSLGIDNSSIIKVCKGVAKTAGGYKWRYHKERVDTGTSSTTSK